MSKDEKLIKRFLSRKNIMVEDCDRLLTMPHGYELHKSSGSHRIYHQKGTTPITVVTPKNSKYVISPYINRIIKDLGLE